MMERSMSLATSESVSDLFLDQPPSILIICLSFRRLKPLTVRSEPLKLISDSSKAHMPSSVAR